VRPAGAVDEEVHRRGEARYGPGVGSASRADHAAPLPLGTEVPVRLVEADVDERSVLFELLERAEGPTLGMRMS
jgi:predicted thioesterase